MKTKSILIVSSSSARHLNVPTIPLYKNQRRPVRMVVALSEPNFVERGFWGKKKNIFGPPEIPGKHRQADNFLYSQIN